MADAKKPTLKMADAQFITILQKVRELNNVHTVFYLQVEVKMRSSLSFQSFSVRVEQFPGIFS